MKVELKEIVKTIKDKEILKGVSFSFETGDIVGFIGNNGAGKTTTIKTFFGEYILNSGEIFIDGNKPTSDDYKKIAFFPDQNNFPKAYGVYDYCYYVYKLCGNELSKKEFNEKFDQILNAVNLTEYKNKKISSLSSGMQKRAVLASILLTNPKAIILDEPTANMDVSSRREFISLLKMLAKEKEIIIVITSHDIEEMDTFINKVVLLSDGKVTLETKFDHTKDNLSKIYVENIGDNKSINNAALGEII